MSSLTNLFDKMSNNNFDVANNEYDIILRNIKRREEQKELKEIVQTRPLVRPKTKIIAVVGLVLLQILLSISMAFGVIAIFKITKLKWLVYLTSYLFFAILFLKIICIKAVECYQHYAKEETRRKCVCIPSCSEYAIAVLKKYNVFVALNKIRIRLFKTCGKVGYVRDEP